MDNGFFLSNALIYQDDVRSLGMGSILDSLQPRHGKKIFKGSVSRSGTRQEDLSTLGHLIGFY